MSRSLLTVPSMAALLPEISTRSIRSLEPRRSCLTQVLHNCPAWQQRRQVRRLRLLRLPRRRLLERPDDLLRRRDRARHRIPVPDARRIFYGTLASFRVAAKALGLRALGEG